MMLLLMMSFTAAHAIVLPPVPDLIAVAEHIPDIFHRNFSAFTFQDLMTTVKQLPGAVANVRMPFAQSPELLPTVDQIGAMDAQNSSERLRYFASLFLLTYFATVLLGTCIMTLGPRCGCCGASASRGAWQAMVTMGATWDVEDGTSLEDDSKSSEAAPAAEADPGILWIHRAERDTAIKSRKVQQRWLVTMAFSTVFCASLAAAVFSLTTDRLSKRTGLDWEIYFLLFTLNCIWLILQAIVAAARAARRARNFAITAFFEGTMSGTWPVISDSYDTLKDVLVGALCLHSESMFLKVLGVISWLYLAAIHFVFLGWHPKLASEDDDGCTCIQTVVCLMLWFLPGDDFYLAELLGSYAPILVMHTTLRNRAEGQDLEDSSCCCVNMCSKLHGFLKGMGDTFLVQAYRQVTPVKRWLLGVENIFQGMVGIAYMVIEGGSIFVALLNVAIPILQIVLTFLLHKPLRRKAAPWFAKRLKLAIQNGDLVMEEQMRSEACEDLGIFTALAPYLADYEGFTELTLEFGSCDILDSCQFHGHGIGDAGAEELAAALGQLQQLKKLKLVLWDNSIGDAGAVALAEAVRRLPRLEWVRVGLGDDNDLSDVGTAAWRQLQEELQSQGCRYVYIDILQDD